MTEDRADAVAPSNRDQALLSDPVFVSAVSRIRLRSEKQADIESLERTYVETGLLPQLDNVNNQVVYGRRGTGKSHILQVLGLRRNRTYGDLAVYIDMRLLGSAQAFVEPNRPLSVQCIGLYKDLLLLVWEHLQAAATDPHRNADVDVMARISDLGDAITHVAQVTASRQVSAERTTTATAGSNVGGEIGWRAASVTAGLSVEEHSANKLAIAYDEVFRDTVVFADVQKLLDAAINALQVPQLILLIDEWTALSPEVQPFMAEFIKRTLLPSPHITVKIASLEYRSKLSVPTERNNRIGFEVGGDISAVLDLDDYYVYERNPDQVVECFEELLYRHVRNELPDGYLELAKVDSSVSLRQALFSEHATFVELVRASEGVVRDFINIFNAAFFDAQRRGRDRVDVKGVREAARKWYETDKAVNLSEDQHLVLSRIITEVIGRKHARSFMLERSHGSHPMIQSLFDYRVIHLIQKGYSDRDNPGVRYNVYTLDYGTYVDLIQTKSQPSLNLFEDESETDQSVPFDDRRSIRRIIVDPALLEPHPYPTSEKF